MNKAVIEKFAVWARTKLISEITYKAGMLGISEKGIAEPLPQSSNDLQLFDIGTKDYAEVAGVAVRQRSALVSEIKRREKNSNYKTAFTSVIEEVAYTWFNRLAAVRFMEVNDYLPSRIRVLSSENPAKSEPDFVTNPFETDLTFLPYEQDRIIQLKDENKLDELFRMLFIKQCNRLHEILPKLFEQTDDYSELLLSISFTNNDGVVYHLTHDIPEDDFNVEKEGQVEIIGWLYQYYNIEPKNQVFADLKKNIKISKEKIPAATQLFTPDWIVRYMVENSLGRLWLEGHSNENLEKKWKYYLEEAEQDQEVKKQLEEIRNEYHSLNPEDIKIIDPCMGSGHILVYAFDVLMQIYESCGWAQREAAQSIVKNNLYGLDIDERAAQLAYFAVMMKARQYDRRFFDRGVQPNVYSPTGYSEGEEFGSLLTVDELEPMPQRPEEISLFDENYETQLNRWNFRRTLAQKYDVVVTNPPYMGASGMNGRLAEFVKKNYPDSKSDASTAFMERTLQLCNSAGFMAMINIPVWMFLSSYEKLRQKMFSQNTISSMVHPGRGIFGSDFGTTSFVIAKWHIKNYAGTYRRLFDKQGEVKSIKERERAFLSGKGAFTAQQENFSKIPGSPVAYWVSEAIYCAYENYPSLGTIAAPRKGNSTSDNNRFLRLWYEVTVCKMNLHSKELRREDTLKKRWVPYNKGGGYRKWYGFNEYVVDWYDDASAIRSIKTAVIANYQYFMKPGLTWSTLTSGRFSIRWFDEGFIFDNGGCCIFELGEKREYLCALLNSSVFSYIFGQLNPTLNFQSGEVAKFPVIIDKANQMNIEHFTKQNVQISKDDYNSFETSWDFKNHPLVENKHSVSKAEIEPDWSNLSYYLKAAYEAWEYQCQLRFDTLKANEEELNRIFIDIYGLQDELTPEVEDKDVTVRKADLKRDIRSLISYAVGCMFGRYSLDTEGLAYAGGEWDGSKYSSFIPDDDNCLPVTDEEYFKDDIVGRFVEFVKIVYGEKTLEENLSFIANALGSKGNTSREIIRNYFLNDFINDHIRIYQKRPIYWMFDSGKQNGFKALVYMHRWNADTIGNVRVEYLHRVQRVYESEIARMQETIDNSSNGREVAAAEKRKDKLTKQLKEAKDYDAKIAHLALSRIDIDLDDGVKVNYEKVQTPPEGKNMGILAKI